MAVDDCKRTEEGRFFAPILCPCSTPAEEVLPPMPRDEDIDVIEAIALANGSVGGPLGQSGVALAGGTPGYMVRPTRVIILREMPDGRQLPIRVDLARAMVDQKERILIQPNDVIMLQMKPAQAFFNGMLNLVNFNTIVDPKKF